MNDDVRCPHCGAKIVRYKHRMNRNLLVALHRLWRFAGRSPVNIKELNLTRNQWDNFQKLRYWDLVAKSAHRGEWFVTWKGYRFLTNSGLRIPLWVQTYRGETVTQSIHEVRPIDVLPRYHYDTIDWYTATQEPL
jgi:DNA-directed RNA polymerase subunit RPC12/RpoP